MLFDRLKNDPILSVFIRPQCEDEGLCVDIDERIEKENILIFKPNDFYNSLNFEKRPASPDCLILVKCQSGIDKFCLTIVELKNTKDFDYQNIDNKFNTCFDDFMSKKFKDYFYRDYVDIKLYLVSKVEIHRRDLGLKMKFLMNKKFIFREKRYMIMPKMPTPVVKPCYC